MDATGAGLLQRSKARVQFRASVLIPFGSINDKLVYTQSSLNFACVKKQKFDSTETKNSLFCKPPLIIN